MKKILFCAIVSTFALYSSLSAQTAEMLNFDGTNDFVSCGNVLPASYTKEAWVKFTALGTNEHIISGSVAGSQHVLRYNSATGRVESGHNGVFNAVSDPGAVVINTWYHYTVTYDAATTTMKLYRNGVLVSTNAAVPAYTGGNDVNLAIRSGGTGFLNGSMDEVRIWNYALTSVEINASRTCELTGAEAGLIVYYNFNQGTSGGNNAGQTTLNDLAPPANNGTLTSFALTGATSNWIMPSIVTTGTSCAGCPSVVASLSSQTNVSCNGGSTGAATVSASGGTSFTYSWAPSGGTAATASSLAAGTYTCTVTNQCANTGTVAVTITEPAALVVSALSQTNVACNGGSTGAASVSASGGTTSYSYNWTPGNPTGDGTASVTGLTAGTWTCTVTDANSCTSTATFSITAPTALVVTAVSQTNISCNGGSNGAASVSASGGTAAYSYNWTPGNPTGDGTASVTGLTAGTWTCTVTDANLCTSTATFSITAPTALVVSPTSQTNISCNGGSNGAASVTASGGTTAYSYNWTPGNPTGDGTASVTGLTASTWTCTVTDANLCTSTATFNITAPSALVVSPTSQTNISCNGGSNGAATVTASGGTTAYAYNWTPGNPTGDGTVSVTGLTASTWTCTVTDANSCTSTATFNITAPSALVVTPVSQTNVSCNAGSNGAASVSASGGTTAYSYNWTPGNPTGDGTASVTGLTAGTWTCTVTDANSCTSTATFSITAPTAISLAATQTNVTCFALCNGSATITPSGGTPGYTFSWAPSGGTGATAFGLCAGSYTCTVTDANGCVANKTVTIVQPPALIVTATSTNVTCFAACNGTGTAAVSGGTAPYTYTWSPSGGNAATASSLCPGTYTITVTDANGCTANTTVTITQPTALSATTMQTNVSCFGGNNGDAMVMVSGGTGSYTYNWTPSGGTAAMAMSLTAGSYTCTTTDANGCTLATTFLITQPSVITGSMTSTNSTCFGSNDGSATVTASGGTGGYTYSWAPTGGTSATASSLTPATYTCTITDGSGCSRTSTVTIAEPSPIVITPSQTNVTCFGAMDGTATVTSTGGTGAHSFSWSTGGNGITETGLDALTYTCTVTDVNGCSSSQTFQITEPPQITTSHTSTDVTCFGSTDGTATITVGGGVPAYTYSWAPGGYTTASTTGLAENMYIIDITDASGCTTQDTITINAPAAILPLISSTNVTCNGAANGTADVTVLGGTSPYTYNWAPTGGSTSTEVNLGPGTYTCMVTDMNGCTGSESVTITEPTVLTTTTSQTDNSCFGGTNGTATVTASGGNGTYSYSWSPSGGTFATASGLAAGTYTCITTDINTCLVSNTFQITEPGAISVFDSHNDPSCAGGNNASATVSVSGGTGAFTYTWSPSGGTNATASGLIAGIYTCTITDANGCTATQIDTINDPASMLDNATIVNVMCGGGNTGSVTLNMTGGTSPYFYYWYDNSNGTSVSNLAVGTYTITIQDMNSCTITDSFTITEPTPLSMTTTSTDITCHNDTDGVGTVTVTGGTPGYTYLWPDGGTTASETNLAANMYNVIATDANGCMDSTYVMIFDPGAVSPFVIGIVHNPTTCGGTNGGFNLSTSGGNGSYTYLWNTGATTEDLVAVGAGIYIDTVRDINGCIGVFTDTLVDPAAPLVTYSVSANSICIADATIDISGTVTPTGGTYSGPGLTGTTFDPAAVGVGMQYFTYAFTDTLNCVGTAMDSISVDSCLGIQDPFAANAWNISPNPTNGEFHLTRSSTSHIHVQCFTSEGKLIRDLMSDENDVLISLEGESTGIYLVRVTEGNNVTSFRVVKN